MRPSLRIQHSSILSGALEEYDYKLYADEYVLNVIMDNNVLRKREPCFVRGR